MCVVRAEHAIGSHCHAQLKTKRDGLNILHGDWLTSCTQDGFTTGSLMYVRTDVVYASVERSVGCAQASSSVIIKNCHCLNANRQAALKC